MSETAVLESHAVTAEPFDKADVKEFRAADTEAGTNICKLLVVFFFYSLCAMAFVTWWAFDAMHENRAEPTTTEAHADH